MERGAYVPGESQLIGSTVLQTKQFTSADFDEKAVVQKVLNGDQEAFREVISQYERLVCHIVFRMVSNAADREEICQEIFCKVYTRLESFRGESTLATWIGRIACHTTINYLKKNKVALLEDFSVDRHDAKKSPTSQLLAVPSENPAQDEQLIAGQQKKVLHEAINCLPALYRAVITLYHLENMSYREISDTLDLPEGTVKSYLYRARKQLKELLIERTVGELT